MCVEIPYIFCQFIHPCNNKNNMIFAILYYLRLTMPTYRPDLFVPFYLLDPAVPPTYVENFARVDTAV